MNTLENDYLKAEILPEAGASLVSLAGKVNGNWQTLMRLTSPQAIQDLNAWEMASFILAPYSNIIPGGLFRFRGQAYTLKTNYEGEAAIHGDVYRHPWKVDEASSGYLACQLDSRQVSDFNYPFPLVVEVHYALRAEMLKIWLSMTNVGKNPMPAGLGIHPFFNRQFAGTEDAAYLQLHATGYYPDNQSPMQDIKPELNFTDISSLGEKNLNHCFGGWDGRARIVYPKSGVEMKLECDDIFGHVVVYNPPEKSYFCVEPVSHANNAFNLADAGQSGTGMKTLRPGERISGTIQLNLIVSKGKSG